MVFRRTRNAGAATNRLINQWAERIDGESGAVGQRLTGAAQFAVKVLRYPTLAVLVIPLPFIIVTWIIALVSSGWPAIFCAIIAALMTLCSALFGWRRYRTLQAVDDPEALTTEFAIAIRLSDRVDETRRNLDMIAGSRDGWRLFSRMRGVWRTMRMPNNWIDSISDLPRARYFLPPRIGTTVGLTIAALWLIPISIVVALLTAIGALASAL